MSTSRPGQENSGQENSEPVFARVPSQVVAPEAEERILRFWEAEKIFERSVSERSPTRRFVFYEGPPTANGEPGVHHAITRVVKDLICRYKTMKGYQVIRKAGWDTHGLPVEIEVEKQLKIRSKEEIEDYGIDNFNRKCKESVFKYQAEWVRMTKRLGFWLDLDHSYVTCTNDYIESIWHILRTAWDAGLLYRGHKVLPYCPRCGTPLSSHEVSQGYADKEDPSIYLRFKIKEDPDTSLLVWTTTPWTLISNVAVAVHPTFTYLKVRYKGEKLVIAERRAEAVLGKDFEILERTKGADLVGLHYQAPFAYAALDGKAHVVVAADFVTGEDGTGLVHIAPAFGADDYNLGRAEGLAFVNPVLEDGTFSEEITPWKDLFVIDANAGINDDLRKRGILFREEKVIHTYPFCWRCDSPLIYYAHPSWYVRTTAFKDEMIALNKTINWYPREFGDNRFGQWLENNVDWALSRDRYWGTPLNIWVCEACSKEYCAGGIDDMRKRAVELKGEIDLHRPWIDTVILKCDCGGQMRRTPEVIDCWFDTGGMPYAQYHYPFENKDLFESQFPADFICEAVDQTRGWFYSLLAISTLMSHRASFKNVMVSELILDEQSQKMSKSRGNVVVPREVFDTVGADPLRWYLYTTSPIWVPTRFSTAGVVEVARKMLGTLRNVHSFFTLYANIDGFDPRVHVVPAAKRPVMDRWLVSRLSSVIQYVDSELAQYEVTRAARALQDFVIDDLSNWYVRRSRRRYWRHEMNDDKMAAYATLYEALETTSRMLAPFLPFVADEIYRHLVVPVRPDAPPSVHLSDYPKSDPAAIDRDLEASMEAVVRCVTLVRAARNRAKIKIKQPLSRARIRLGIKVDKDLLSSLLHHLKEEVNVKEVVLESDLSGYVTYEVLPKFEVLGPKLGEKVKVLKTVLKGLDLAAIGRLEGGLAIQVKLDGEEFEIGPTEVVVRRTEREGYLFESDGANAIVLDAAITPELLAEGYARELVSRIQNLRKQSGLDVTDKIKLYVAGGALVENAFEVFGEHIKAETLAVAVESVMPGGAEPFEFAIGDETVKVALEKA
ncbi:MAG: isoleucine--tRNA ligase [Candidatus Eisenbacteria bacterium]